MASELAYKIVWLLQEKKGTNTSWQLCGFNSHLFFSWIPLVQTQKIWNKNIDRETFFF